MPTDAGVETPANVLLVDDTPANLKVLGGMLKEQGCVVRPAPSGKLALRFAEADPPDIILLDIMMPEMDGYEVCRRLKQSERLKDIPVVFISALNETLDKVKAFAAGGVDYITKPFQFEEVEARVRTHLRIRGLQVRLEDQNRRLEAELANAANYVSSLIPPPIKEGDIQTRWLYVPSAQLGGDSLGYHWINDRYFALYLLDVSGHGVGAALLSVSILNALRTHCLPADLLRPDEVLAALNTRFPRGDQYGLFFTIWYGVFDRDERMLRYANGGHPPALLIDGEQQIELDTDGIPIGLFTEAAYEAGAVQVTPGSRLYVYSDGCYEIHDPEGELHSKEEMIQCLNSIGGDDSRQLDVLYQLAMKVRGGERLEDDFSIVRARFV